MTQPRRALPLPAWLAVAALLHGGLVVVGWVMPHRAPPRAGDAEPVELAIELDPSALLPTDAPEPRSQPEPDLAEPAPAVAPSRLAQEPVPSVVPAQPELLTALPSAQAPTAEVPVPATPGPEGPTAGQGSGPARLSLDALGLTGGNRHLSALRTEPAPRLPPAPAPAPDVKDRLDRSLAAGLAEQSRRLGLGPGGAVISALEHATRSAHTPPSARATFLAVVDGTGAVTTVRLQAASESTPAWQDVAQRALRALKARRLRPPDGARPIELQIEVTCALQLPSGAESGVDTDFKLGAVSGTFDVADVGARAQRMVRARLVSQRVL